MKKYILVQIKAIDALGKEHEFADYAPLADLRKGKQQVTNIDYKNALHDPGFVKITQVRIAFAGDK